jgi:hypothetical protein
MGLWFLLSDSKPDSILDASREASIVAVHKICYVMLEIQSCVHYTLPYYFEYNHGSREYNE